MYKSVSSIYTVAHCFTCAKDLEMFDEATDTPTVARTSNLNEELGQVSECQCYIALVNLLFLNRNSIRFISVTLH